MGNSKSFSPKKKQIFFRGFDWIFPNALIMELQVIAGEKRKDLWGYQLDATEA